MNPSHDPSDIPDWLAGDDSHALDGPPDLSSLLDLPPLPVAPVPPPVVAAPMIASEPIVYGIRLKVPDAAKQGLRVEHHVPAGLRLLSTNPPVTQHLVGGHLIWDFINITPGTMIAIRLKGVPTDQAALRAANQARFQTSFLQVATADSPIIRPSFALQLSSSDTALIGSTVEWQLVVTNTGNWPMEAVTLQGQPSAGLELLSAATMPIGGLSPHQSVTLTLRTIAVQAGPQSLRVQATASDLDYSETVSTELMVTQPELAIEVDTPERWSVGVEEAFTLVIANRGNAEARAIQSRLIVPNGWDFVRGATWDVNTRTCQWIDERLRPGATTPHVVYLRPHLPGTATMHVEVETPRCPMIRSEQIAHAIIRQEDSAGILEQFARALAEADTQLLPKPSHTDADTSRREHQHLCFSVAGTEYAFPLAAVQEVGRPPQITMIPHAPDWLAGVANIRGDVVSMVDLAMFFSAEQGEVHHDERRLLIVHSKNHEITAGLLIDRVRGLRILTPQDIQTPTAPLNAPATAYMRGVATIGQRVTVVLDTDRLLLAPGFSPFSSTRTLTAV